MRRKLSVTVLMDDSCVSKDEFRRYAPEAPTEYHVVKSLRELGHRVRITGVGNKLEPIVADLTRNRPDLVFNLTEQYRDERRLDTSIAGLLEMLDLPFTGSGSMGLMLCRDKALCKRLLSTRRIAVPRFFVVGPGKRLIAPRRPRFPLVVKPLFEDGSDGISNSSLVKSLTELEERVRMVHAQFNQPAIAEEYIEGRELYVAVLGNGRLSVLPPRELVFGSHRVGGPVIATRRLKWNRRYQRKWKVRFGFGRVDRSLMHSISRTCKKAYRLLQMNDYGRIDIRLTSDNRVVVLEANPNPGLDCEDEIAHSALRAGIRYTALIDRIVRASLKRYEDSHRRGDRSTAARKSQSRSAAEAQRRAA